MFNFVVVTTKKSRINCSVDHLPILKYPRRGILV